MFLLLAAAAVFVFVRHDNGTKWSSAMRTSYVTECVNEWSSSTHNFTAGECGCMADYLAGHGVTEKDVANISDQSDISDLPPAMSSKILDAFGKCS